MTASLVSWANLVLLVTSIVLVHAARVDWREYRIPNTTVLLLTGLFLIYALITPRWSTLGRDLVFALFMFMALMAGYAMRWMGGGDVKLLAAAFLWTGLGGALLFSILLALCSTVYAIGARIGWLKSQLGEGRRRIPLAPVISVSLIATLALQVLWQP